MGAARLSQADINNEWPALACTGNAQASETDRTVMGNSQQSSSVTNLDRAMAMAAASSPAPAPALSSNMFSAVSHLDDCGDEVIFIMMLLLLSNTQGFLRNVDSPGNSSNDHRKNKCVKNHEHQKLITRIR